MHVHLERGLVPDHEERVAERRELQLERIGVQPLALDHEAGAVAKARELPVRGLDSGPLLLGCLGQRHSQLTCEAIPADDLEQAGRARVNDAGVTEHVELLLRAEHSLVAALDKTPR